ncbi:MAG TPA: isoprenylcysteine carboxylmethyltransferase family protein [Candidatus Cybelea sp.]|nr:isoprenylcysteine carboxylmethyltransferase family protein [Candidatus Cybelea sp.]
MVLWIVLGLVALQRVVELFFAARNTRRLLARGGVEIAGVQYPFIVLLHAAWLASMAIFIPSSTVPNWWWLGVYALLQPLRIWTIASLGPYWTTRIITVPGAPLVRHGPYRILRHPNYVIVCAEIFVLPFAFGAIEIAILFSFFNAALLSWRIRTEERVLISRRDRYPERRA